MRLQVFHEARPQQVRILQASKGFFVFVFVFVLFCFVFIALTYQQRTSHSFKENQPMHRKRNFLKENFNENS